MSVWVRRQDTQDEFETIAYQDAPPPPMTPELYEACKRAVHVIKRDGEILRAARATLFILERIGWGYGVPRLLRLPPFIFFAELGYTIVARNRGLFSRFLFRRER